MSSVDQIRTSFRRFAGDVTFVKFVYTLNRLPIRLERLRHWQQTLWDSFASENPDAPRDFFMIRDCLAICELHDMRLNLDNVDAPFSHVQHTRTQSPSGDCNDFPYSGWGVSAEEWGNGNTRKISVLYCPQCRKLRSQSKYSDRMRPAAPNSGMEYLRKLEDEYRSYASSGVNAETFYRTIRDNGCNKLQGFVLLRDLMNCTLKDAIRIDSNYQDGST